MSISLTLRRSVVSAAATLGAFAALAGLPGMARAQSVPAGTAIMLTVDKELTSGKTQPNEAVTFRIAQDVRGAGGSVLIPAGSTGTSRVVQSKKRAFAGQPGKLELMCDSISTSSGSMTVNARGSKYGRDNRGPSVGASIFFTPLWLIVNGRDAVIKPGEQLAVVTQ